MKYDISVATDLYTAGNTEDGQPFIAELYYVVMQYEDGRKFQHQAIFFGAEYSEDEDGFGYADVRETALANAERLAERVRNGNINFRCWDEVDPAYGSDAYVAQGTEAKRVFAERLEG
jgi:hypothetical protein